MVAYNFQPRFEIAIKAMAKTGTIRAEGKRRHAMPDDALQLYTGMRTRKCRLLARAICAENAEIYINFNKPLVTIRGQNTRTTYYNDALDLFAVLDGFSDFAEMAAFWQSVHGATRFVGRYITWNADSVQVAP